MIKIIFIYKIGNRLAHQEMQKSLQATPERSVNLQTELFGTGKKGVKAERPAGVNFKSMNKQTSASSCISMPMEQPKENFTGLAISALQSKPHAN